MTEISSLIPSRLKNAADGGHVCGSEDVIDDTLEMTQAKINTIVLTLTDYARKTDFDLDVLQQAITDGNLAKYELKPGDYKTINGHDYVIAGLNPMKGSSTDYRLSVNHVGLIVIPHTKQKWNASGNTYTGADSRGAGYLNSDLHYYLKNTLLPLVNTDLGSDHLLGFKQQLSSAVNTAAVNRIADDSNKGAASSATWESNCKICALSEVQVVGGAVCSASLWDTYSACRQLEVFQKYAHTAIFGSESVWLRDIASATDAVLATKYGDVRNQNVSYVDGSVAALILYK